MPDIDDLISRIYKRMIAEEASQQGNKDLYLELEALLGWWRNTLPPGQPPIRQVSLVGCAFFYFSKFKKEVIDLYFKDEVLKYRMDEIEYWNEADVHDMAFRAEVDSISGINDRLKEYYQTLRGKQATYVLEGVDVPNRWKVEDKYKIKFTFKVRFLDEIKESILRYNKNHKDFSMWNKNTYVPQSGVVSEEEVSARAFISAEQSRKFFDKELLDSPEPSIKKLDPLGLEAIIEEKSRKTVIIIAEPGIGKSTALKHIAYKYSYDEIKPKETPIYVDLRTQTPQEALWDCLNVTGPEAIKNLGSEKVFNMVKIASGFLFLLDGFNEISSGDAGENKRDTIGKLVNSSDSKGNRFVITSRRSGYPENIEGYVCDLKELSDEQREDFIQFAGVQDINDFILEVDKKGLDIISRIPFFLEYICSYYNGEDENTDEEKSLKGIPNSKGKLLQKIIDRRMKLEVKMKGVIDPVVEMYELLDEVLPCVAYSSYDNNSANHFKKEFFAERIGSRELKGIMRSYINCSPATILKACNKYGIVENYKSDYAFSHQLFQDYFAAVWLKLKLEKASTKERLDIFLSHFKFKSWDEILEILFGLIPDKLRREIIHPIYDQAIKTTDHALIRLLIDLSGVTNNPKLCDRIFSNNNVDIRHAIVSTMKVKTSEAVEVLNNYFNEETGSGVRKAVVGALGQIATLEAVKILEDLFVRERDLWFRKELVWSLRLTNTSKTVGVLKACFNKEKDLEFRKAVIVAFGESLTPEAVKILKGFIVREKNLWLHKDVASVIGKEDPSWAINVLKVLFCKEEDISFRKDVARVLGGIPTCQSVKGLKDFLKKEKDPRFCLLVASILTHEEPALAVKILNEMIDGTQAEDFMLLRDIATSLGETRQPQAVNILKELYNRERGFHYRMHVANALANIETTDAIEVLENLFKNETNIALRSSLISVIAQIKTPQTYELLKKLYLKEEDSFIYLRILGDLGRKDPSWAVKTCIELFDKEEDLNACCDIASTLGTIRTPESVKLLEELFAEEDAPILRQSVVDALGEIMTIESIKALKRIFDKEDNSELLINEMWALAEIRTPEAIRLLKELYNMNIDFANRMNEYFELSEMRKTDEKTSPKVIEVLKVIFNSDASSGMRSEVVRTLGELKAVGEIETVDTVSVLKEFFNKEEDSDFRKNVVITFIDIINNMEEKDATFDSVYEFIKYLADKEYLSLYDFHSLTKIRYIPSTLLHTISDKT